MSNKYYEKYKARLQKEAWKKIWKSFWRRKRQKAKKVRVRYQNFTEEEKRKICQYYQERKQMLPEYRRIII